MNAPQKRSLSNSRSWSRCADGFELFGTRENHLAEELLSCVEVEDGVASARSFGERELRLLEQEWDLFSRVPARNLSCNIAPHELSQAFSGG